MTVLVTGAGGFIGSTLTARLLADGEKVIGVDALTDYYDVSLKRVNLARLESPQFTFIEDDLATMPLEQLGQVTRIFHLAGQPGVRKSWGTDFAAYTHANVTATQRLLEHARAVAGLERFVYASSSSVYGNAERFPTTELDLPNPMSPYGVTKLAGEHLCRAYASAFGLPTVSLRFFSVYGPRQRPDMAFTRFLTAAAVGTPIDLYGTGGQVRDFTFVDDVVSAIVAAGATSTAPGSVFNVAGGSSASVNDALQLIAAITGREVLINRFDTIAGDVNRTGGDTTAIRDQLGWHPTTELEAGLRKHWDWVTEMLAQKEP